MRRRLVLLVMAVVSCTDSSVPTEPSSSGAMSASAAASTVTSFAVSGAVRDTHLNGLAGVPVEIIDGPMTGTVTQTDARGLFRFAEPFTEEATLRATMAGYLSATARVLRPPSNDVVGGPQTLVTIELPSPEPSIDISGTYTLTVGDKLACETIPEALRMRSYDVVIAPHTNAHSFRVNFTDPNVVDAWNPAIEIRLKGSRMQMVIGDWGGGVIEDTPSGWLNFWGFARATMTESGVSGAFLQGGSAYTYCPGPRPGKGTNSTFWNCPTTGTPSCTNFHYSLTRR